MICMTIRDEKEVILTNHSSKGNQPKWLQDGYWYKADGLGYESLAETLCSRLLQHSSLAEMCVIYEPVKVIANGKEMRACRSLDFKKPEQSLIPLERLIRKVHPRGLAALLAYMPDPKDRISYTVEMVEKLTGIEDFGFYLTDMLIMDAFFLNEDRHTNNIALAYDASKRTFEKVPYFDMGAAMFSDTRLDFPIHLTYEECLSVIKAKPFSRDFDEQMDAAELLYDSSFHFDFRATDIIDIAFEGMDAGQLALYSEAELRRAEETLRMQARKYACLFA